MSSLRYPKAFVLKDKDKHISLGSKHSKGGGESSFKIKRPLSREKQEK